MLDIGPEDSAVSIPFTRLQPQTNPARVPRLEQSDRIAGDEFERRYDAIPDLKKAKLLDGEMDMSSRVRMNFHGRPHASVIA